MCIANKGCPFQGHRTKAMRHAQGRVEQGYESCAWVVVVVIEGHVHCEQGMSFSRSR